MKPVVVRARDGETVTAGDTRSVVIKAAHQLVDMTESRYAPGERGPEPHIHRRHTDAFYVLEGALVFQVGPHLERVRAPVGSLVAVPAGVIHTFSNEGPDDARFLNVHAPSTGFADSLRARRDGRDRDAERWDSFDPPRDGGRPASDVVVRGPGEGDAITVGSSTAVFKAEGGDAGGQFSLTEVTLGGGFPGPVAHRHETLVDSFYVLDGTVTVRVGDDLHDLGAGSYAFVPPGTVHTFMNRSDAPARLLNVMAPGGFEQYLKEVARRSAEAGGPVTPEAMAEIASRYDFRPA